MSSLMTLLDGMDGPWLRTLGYRSNRSWPGEDDDLAVLAHVVRLGEDQNLQVEQDFMEAQLSFSCASLGGTEANGVPWVMLIQAVPASVVWSANAPHAEARHANAPHAEALWAMLGELVAVLEYNDEAETIAAGELDRGRLLGDYILAGVDLEPVEGWSTRDLLRGEMAEVAGADLGRVVAGYPECAFPGRPHCCEHDVFDDVFAAWRRGDLAKLDDGTDGADQRPTGT